MDEDLQNIENLFRERLADKEAIPSSKVWNGIDNILDKDRVASIQKKYNKLKRGALLLLLISLGLGVNHLAEEYRNSGKAYNSSLHKTENDSAGNIITENQQVLQQSVTTANTENKKEDVIDNNTSGNNLPTRLPVDGSVRDKSVSADLIAGSNTKQGYNTNLTTAKSGVSSKNGRRNNTGASYKIEINAPGIAEEEGSASTGIPGENQQQFSLSFRVNHIGIDKPSLQDIHPGDIHNRLLSMQAGKIHELNGTKNHTVHSTNKLTESLSRFSVTAFFSPDIAWYSLEEDEPGNQPEDREEIERGEKHDFSSTVGALVEYRLDKHWSLQSGITYSKTNISADPKTIYAQADNSGSIEYRINASSGYGYVLPSISSVPAVGDSLYAFAFKHTIRYIGIPAAIKYNILKGKFNFSITAGISLNFLLSGKIETTVGKGINSETVNIDNLQGMKNIYCSGMAGIGIDYNINKRIALSIAPAFRIALNAINKDALVRSYPKSFGIAIGLKTTL